MRRTVGILAHVDAGKTSFSEQALCRLGAIRTAGRVDHGDTFLDLHAVERERGITVFSDQATFEKGGDRWYWVDTPGHADFLPEAERALDAVDLAVLIVSAPEGVESHTETLWRLLEARGLPVFIFVNKCDRPDGDFDRCLDELREMLSPDIADLHTFDGAHFDASLAETVAERDEALLEALLEDRADDALLLKGLRREIADRRIFPAFAGAALTGEGVDNFLGMLELLSVTDHDKHTDEPFAARVYKIRHDERGVREVYFKLTAGRISVKDEIMTPAGPRKLNDLKLRHGGKGIAIQSAQAGDVVYTSGLEGVRAQDGLGALSGERRAPEAAAMTERAVLSELPKPRLLELLRLLEEEDPALCVTPRARTGEICVRIGGEIGAEVLTRIAKERFGADITFGAPRILYRETVAAPTVGVGHYEPLRHYAETVLRLVPTEPGSGVSFVSRCHVDALSLNWQRLIETHVFERTYPGVLTGAPLTDVRVELLAGRAHLKHTEGGDFREATCRAIRNGLMYAECVLLEPVAAFSLRLPEEVYGGVTGDLSRLGADAGAPVHLGGGMLRVEGECPLRRFMDYPEAFRARTHGRGGVTLTLSRYAPVPESDAAAIIAEANYNPLAEDSPDSVFCSHGAGHVVPWQEVRANMHCEIEF